MTVCLALDQSPLVHGPYGIRSTGSRDPGLSGLGLLPRVDPDVISMAARMTASAPGLRQGAIRPPKLEEENITASHRSVLPALLKEIAACALLFTPGGLVAQPAAPGLEGHYDLRSREPSDSALRYEWACANIRRSIEFRQRYRQVLGKDGAPGIVAAWSIGRYLRDGDRIDPVDGALSAFVSSLQAIHYIAGRCFDTDGEVRISGIVEGSNVPVTRTFRIR